MAEQRTPAEMIIEAVKGLPEPDRDTALAWLIDRNAGFGSGSGRRLPVPGGHRLSPVVHDDALRHFGSELPKDHQAVMIRMPTGQHAQLRSWCEEHGFSMATVVRGLVDRFLEQQATEQPAAG